MNKTLTVRRCWRCSVVPVKSDGGGEVTVTNWTNETENKLIKTCPCSRYKKTHVKTVFAATHAHRCRDENWSSSPRHGFYGYHLSVITHSRRLRNALTIIYIIQFNLSKLTVMFLLYNNILFVRIGFYLFVQVVFFCSSDVKYTHFAY